MASTSGTAEHDGAQQVHKKPKRKCGSCASCCACYTQCMSGFIFLLIIAGLVLCVRFFLEFPFILNGFARANNLTEQLVASDIALSSMNSATQQYDLEAQSGTCQMFVGSFQLLNESYLSQYNVSSSTEFQAMDKRIQNMLNLTFNKSLLKATYRKSSVFSLRPDPFTAHFQLMFCNDTSTDSETSAKTVLQVIISYNISLAQTDIYMNNQTVILGKEAPCPINVDLSSAWPWQAIILENQTAVCLGSLLTDSWVVSTAGCLKNRNTSLLSVIMGSDSSLRSSTWKVSKVMQHPNFTTSANNIALVLLSLPVWFNSSIMPTCLPQTSQDPAMGIRCSATTESILSAVSTIGLLNVSGTVTSASNCLCESQSGTIYISNTLSKTWINQVDLGNSLTCINTDGTVYLQGIFSYEQNSNTSSLCLKYTSIGSTVEWVKSYIIV